MDMAMSMDSDPSVVNLPVSDAKCVAAAEKCLAFYAAENTSQEATPWAGQFEYGHWTTYYYIGIIGILMLVYACQRLQDRQSPSSNAKSVRSSIRQRTVAAGRYIAYRRIHLLPRWLCDSPSLSMLTFYLASTVVLMVLVFSARPYYRHHLGYGSPPIAIRSGLMAFACMPILIALAGKANIVTLLTGISHEKLNVVHQFTAWVSLALSAIHTIPFFIASYRDEGAGGYARVKKEFYAGAPRQGSNMYSGVPPFAILFALCITSLPYIRHRFYESFYAAHILLGITYVGLLFWHAGNTIDSWSYLWATVALWLASWVARMFWFTRPLNVRGQWLRGSPTSLIQLPGDMTKLEIWAPEGFSYGPAQHCFLRFPFIAPFDNHPFTICSVPPPAGGKNPTESWSSPETSQSLMFLIRTHAGFTCKLASYCSAQPELTTLAWIDGPYGGIRRPLEHLYDNVILIAGGSGISACLPWVLHFLGQSSQDLKIKNLTLVWVMRKAEHFGWVEKELQAATTTGRQSIRLNLRLFVTDNSEATAEAGKGLAVGKTPELTATERGSFSAKRMGDYGDVSYGRPVLASLIGESVCEGSNAVFGCGPASMRTDIANACADTQERVIKGKVEQVVMYLEEFGW